MARKFEAPSWLDRDGKSYWRRVAPSLAREGKLIPASADLLACAAAAWQTWREANATLKQQGRVILTHTGASKPNPWLAVEKQAFETLARVHKQLGIGEQPETDDDELDSLISGEIEP